MVFFMSNYMAAYTTGYVTKKYIPQRWSVRRLYQAANHWCQQLRRRIGATSEHNSWWSFINQWPTHAQHWVNAIAQGRHPLSPRIRYRFKNNNEVVEVWSYIDRLLVHLLLTIIKPTFKHVISPWCVHLQGPSCIKTVTADIQAALTSQQYGYVIRSDIKSYYASIQLKTTYDDPILLSYCEAIITAGVEQEGEILLPTQGIPLRSSLSPFFGALYFNLENAIESRLPAQHLDLSSYLKNLFITNKGTTQFLSTLSKSICYTGQTRSTAFSKLKALDDAFATCPGIFYLRYMDDLLILIPHERAYRRAKKRFFTMLRQLGLQIAPHKTRMGRVDTGFHFLGVQFEVALSPQSQTQVRCDVHSRTCRRALDPLVCYQAKAMGQDAVHPTKMQRYLAPILIRLVTWWSPAVNQSKQTCITHWLNDTKNHCQPAVWVGSELLTLNGFRRDLFPPR